MNFAIEGQTYIDENRKLTTTRVIFRSHLRDKALLWSQCRDASYYRQRSFLDLPLVVRKEVDQTRFLNLVFTKRQRGRSIVEYTKEGDQLNAEC